MSKVIRGDGRSIGELPDAWVGVDWMFVALGNMDDVLANCMCSAELPELPPGHCEVPYFSYERPRIKARGGKS